MKKIIILFLLLAIVPTDLLAQTNIFKLEKRTTFFPDDKKLAQENIDWWYLTVPENWDKPSGKTIKIAVAVLKSASKNKESNPVVYIDGGPGSGGIASVGPWLVHPLRQNSDIVLFDVRGTGNSLPKFCPDLGKQFFEILAKNQNSTQDEQQKTIAAVACKQDLLNRNIDINAYNSKSIVKDLNALKVALKYDKWNVYAVSYGTYTAQVYANDFPQDIKSLILDSSISDITQYYNRNTENYMNSLKKVFNACKNDPNCNQQYPDLEKTYFETIEKLSKNPVTVKVDPNVVASGQFTYNAEDFKIAIQQSLYQKRLIEVLPLLITEFHKGNKGTLSSLVAAFSGALGLDYGQYYCVSCKEAIPNNSVAAFNKDGVDYKKLKGGLSFYKSDFAVCDKWNSGAAKPTTLNDLSNLSTLTAPVLVLAGNFDPITPASNGKVTVERFQNGFLINAPISGHTPGFSKLGVQITNEFVKNPHQKPDAKELESDNKVHFVTDVKISGGVSNFARSLNEFNWLFLAPFFIALIVLLISIFFYCYELLANRKNKTPNKLLKSLIVLTSLLSFFTIIGFIVAVNTTAQGNFFILAFGIPNQFNYLFTLQWIFIAFTLISILYFVLKIKTIPNTSVIATILFSFLLIGIYFEYWGFLF